MRKFLQTVAMVLVCGALICPQVEARGRNDHSSPTQQHSRPGNNGRPSRPSQPSQPTHSNNRPSSPGNHTKPATQPAGNNRPGNSGNNRPGNNGNHNGNQPSRPGNNGNHNGNQPSRPGNNGNHNGNQPSRPGNNGNNRPGNPPANNHNRPGNPPSRPNPAPNYSHYYRPTPPSRPHMPPSRPYYRPTPPPSWRPPRTWRPINTVLGITFGAAINVSLNALFNSGYTVSSYSPDAIYLTNVPMLNYTWPDATMYYVNGALAGSEFVYSTPYSNSGRYDIVYNSLCGSYGMPVSVNTVAGVITASWWGPNNQYISLSYGPQYTGAGALQYFTTLSFGR